jgi:cob(I)alamin adenosyltransferase
MANRLTKIYTRMGDNGMTGLANGERVAKSALRVETCGTVDETNSAIGLILAEAEIPDAIRDGLTKIQHELFDIGAELALPGHVAIRSDHVAWLERELDRLNSALPALKDFVLPGGTRASAACHLARAVCRRAERCAWKLAEEAEINPELLRYLNRLSDLLFVVARAIAQSKSAPETIWQAAHKGGHDAA